ncbi:MAG TPA: DNA glycosylase, partial [Chthoniobacterales bacterium]|nr:DNA glycosylase [Chthoniobacterales bacterium]
GGALRSTMRIFNVSADDFDLEKTLDSGQVFHWQKIGNTVWGTIGEIALCLEQDGGFLKMRAAGTELDGLKPSSFKPGHRVGKGEDLERLVRHYFALDHRLAKICAAFPRDPTMTAARDFCRGLRIIRQPRWECLATFITSSMKQVAHIRQISLTLRRRYGESKQLRGHSLFTFPSAELLAELTEPELRACALGYRAKNLLATARLVARGEANLEAWSKLPDDALRAQLCELPGVGAKVANCVMLFAYERLRAFPIDVWIERVLRQQYFPRKRKVTPQQLRQFCDDYFGEHGGYAQQYLFHHARKGTTVQAKAVAVVPPRDLRYDLEVKPTTPGVAPK